MDTKEIIDKIFKDPKTKYELSEFEALGKPVDQMIEIYPKTMETGREAGKTKYFLKSFVPFSSGKEEVQVFADGGKTSPEEIVRQLWVYKLIHSYGYQADEIELEKSIHFGTEVGTKAADIVVYTDSDKEPPKIVIEVKKPKRKDGIEQLKSYLNVEGSPVGVWSNGSDSIILYRFIFVTIEPEKEKQLLELLELSEKHRKESRLLLEKAKTRVEQLIEQAAEAP